MDFFLKVCALGALILFGVATEHCRLEAFPIFSSLQCCCAEDSAASPASDCGEEVCAGLESGGFRAEDSLVDCPEPALLLLAQWLELEVPVSVLPNFFRVETGPPELDSSWQFALRAAPPARAPSFLS